MNNNLVKYLLFITMLMLNIINNSYVFALCDHAAPLKYTSNNNGTHNVSCTRCNEVLGRGNCTSKSGCSYCGSVQRPGGSSGSGGSDSGTSEPVDPCTINQHNWGGWKIDWTNNMHVKYCTRNCDAYIEGKHVYENGICECGLTQSGKCEHKFNKYENIGSMHKVSCINGCISYSTAPHNFDNPLNECVCGLKKKESCNHKYNYIQIEGNSSQHLKTCKYNCGFSELEDHSHALGIFKCACGLKTSGECSHKFYYENLNVNEHLEICEKNCGYSEIKEHDFSGIIGKCACGAKKRDSCEHKYEKWKKANATQHFRDCTVCKDPGARQTSSHIFRLKIVSKATCTNTGLAESICILCDAQEEGAKKVLIKASHSYDENRICTACGEKDTNKCTKNKLAPGHGMSIEYKSKNDTYHYIISYCKVCDVTFRKESLKHFLKQSTTESGINTECKVCGFASTKNHKVSKSYIPKDNQYHIVIRTCSNCNYTFDNIVERHVPGKNGKCINCYEENVEIPESIEVFEEKVIELYVGEEIDLTDLRIGESLVGVSSKASIATLNEEGIIIANKAGEVVIQIKIGNKVVDEIKVIVKKEKLETTTKGITIKEGEGGNVPIEVKTANKDTATVVYTSSNPKLVAVNSDGTFTTNEEYLSDGKSEKVTITATTVNSKGKTVTATYTVTVTAKDVYYNEYQNGKANVAVIEPEKSSENKEEKLPGVVIYFGGDGILRTNFTGNNGHTQYMENARNGVEYEDYIFTVQSTEDGNTASAKSAKDVIPILRQLVKEGKIDPENIKVVGHSRGGIATTNLLKEMEKEENSDLKISEAIIVDGAYTDNLDTYTKAMDNGTKLQIYASDLDNRNIAQSSRKVVEELSSREEYSDMFVGQEVEGENHSTVLTCDLVSAAIDELAGKI